jgi:hypothetical protein
LIEVRIQKWRCLLEKVYGENPSHPWWLGESEQEQAKNMGAAARGRGNTLEHHNQVRRGEEEEVNLSRYMRSDCFVFKLVVGGTNMFGLAPNLVNLFLTLINSIWLHGLGFGSLEDQI